MESNIYLTRSPSGPVGCANTFYEALEGAHKLSLRTSSPLLAPSEIECLNTGERLNATVIESWWRKLGWPLPEPHGKGYGSARWPPASGVRNAAVHQCKGCGRLTEALVPRV